MMLASQLLRIPQILQADVDDDTHDFAINGSKPTKKKNLRTIAVQSNGSGRESDHLTYEIGAKDYFFNAPDFECNILLDDFSNCKETEVKESITFKKGTHFYTGKKIRECELPELIVCYKESTYHDIKDICVDEGVVPSEKKYDAEFLPNDDGKSLICKDCEDEDECGSEDEGKSSSRKDADENRPDGLKSSSESESDIDRTEVGKENCNAPRIDNIAREGLVSSSSFSVNLFRPLTSPHRALLETSCDARRDVSQQPGQKLCMEAVPSKKKIPARLLCYDSKVEGGTITFNFTCRKTASSTCKSNDIVTEQPLNLLNEFLSEDDKISSQVHFGERESNFSVARTSSGLITFSGQIPFSGSISLGSDSSTNSTRSFAFPILQPEWSSSPVRMAKADRRHFRKYRGWRHGLLCCRGF